MIKEFIAGGGGRAAQRLAVFSKYSHVLPRPERVYFVHKWEHALLFGLDQRIWVIQTVVELIEILFAFIDILFKSRPGIVIISVENVKHHSIIVES